MRYRMPIAAAIAALFLMPAAAEAQEVSLIVGRFLGDDLIRPDVSVGDFLPTSFADTNVYGVRVGFGLLLIDAEASFLTGKSALFEGTPVETDTRFTYLEGTLVVRLLPGPITPFLAAGGGLHRVSFSGPGDPDFTTFGYTVGVGAKVMLGKIGARADVRDHITPMNVADLDQDVLDFLGLDADATLHNFELSVGLVVRF